MCARPLPGQVQQTFKRLGNGWLYHVYSVVWLSMSCGHLVIAMGSCMTSTLASMLLTLQSGNVLLGNGVPSWLELQLLDGYVSTHCSFHHQPCISPAVELLLSNTNPAPSWIGTTGPALNSQLAFKNRLLQECGKGIHCAGLSTQLTPTAGSKPDANAHKQNRQLDPRQTQRQRGLTGWLTL